MKPITLVVALIAALALLLDAGCTSPDGTGSATMPSAAMAGLGAAAVAGAEVAVIDSPGGPRTPRASAVSRSGIRYWRAG